MIADLKLKIRNMEDQFIYNVRRGKGVQVKPHDIVGSIRSIGIQTNVDKIDIDSIVLQHDERVQIYLKNNETGDL